MNMREKILLGAVALAIGYAGYEFFWKKETADAWTPGAAAAEKALAEMAVPPGGKNDEALHTALLTSAAQVWEKDPFIRELHREKEKPEEKAAPGDAPVPEWVYMGYIAMGDLRMALISGMEYTEGEALAGWPDVRVLKIGENEVVLAGPGERRVVLQRDEGGAW